MAASLNITAEWQEMLRLMLDSMWLGRSLTSCRTIPENAANLYMDNPSKIDAFSVLPSHPCAGEQHHNRHETL